MDKDELLWTSSVFSEFLVFLHIVLVFRRSMIMYAHQILNPVGTQSALY